ncbi:peptidase M50 [Desulfallas sp. Bu1-1]|uniref:site-2 protease family protein n=1 Tax=Desulfallas sp. Bu1-1 TaxID=2787620 RepID=UPI00189EA701|nr:site-2 protease family protein [Desulfallas sp. Bu1-1]MBF7083708.1 peptidase M50 [Desulfallas sp. Bu1-1]
MRLGRLLGVELYLNPFFLILLALFFMAGVLGRGLVAFGVVLVHEMAHALVARRMGVPLDEVELLPFGGVARTGAELAVDPAREIPVAVAGPASNLIMFALGVACKNYGLWHSDLGPFFLQCNLLVGMLNLLPAIPLDGGRICRAFLSGRIGVRRATYRVAGLGQFFGVMIALAGLLGIRAGYCGLDIPVTALFLFYAATRERMAAPYLFMQLVMRKQNELAREGLLPAAHLVALENAPLGKIIGPFVPRRFHLVVVLDRDWRYLGTVTETAVIDALLNRGADIPVGDLLK